MTERQITDREQWLEGAIDTTRAFIETERAENEYDLMHAAPGSTDYVIATDSQACLALARTTLTALEAEMTEIRRRSVMRGSA